MTSFSASSHHQTNLNEISRQSVIYYKWQTSNTYSLPSFIKIRPFWRYDTKKKQDRHTNEPIQIDFCYVKESKSEFLYDTQRATIFWNCFGNRDTSVISYNLTLFQTLP